MNNKITVAGFDPPASTNLGWAILTTDDSLNRTGRYVDAGVFSLPDEEGDRLLAIRDFLVDLVETHDINVMCFERAIGNGVAFIREMIGENTGVIKLVGASYGVDFVAIHTSTMGKQFTGSGAAKGKKSRIKSTARDIFYPDQSFKSIANHNDKECFEHQADAIGFCATYLLQLGIPIEGPGGKIEPQNDK